MADTLRGELQFRSSSRCSGGNCVEIALLPDGSVAVHDGTDRTRRPLAFGRRQWFRFIAGMKSGQFDL
jgi:Domain of unknown function (DUF397)